MCVCLIVYLIHVTINIVTLQCLLIEVVVNLKTFLVTSLHLFPCQLLFKKIVICNHLLYFVVICSLVGK